MKVLVAQTRRGGAYDEAFRRGNRCAVCGSDLVEATCGQPGMLWVGCPDRSHEGFERIKSVMEFYREGTMMGADVVSGIEAGLKRWKRRRR